MGCQWTEIMCWKHYQPDISTEAIIRIWRKNKIFANTCIGRAILKLPKSFEKMETHILDLKKKGKNKGVLQVRCIIVRHGARKNYFVNQKSQYGVVENSLSDTHKRKYG